MSIFGKSKNEKKQEAYDEGRKEGGNGNMLTDISEGITDAIKGASAPLKTEDEKEVENARSKGYEDGKKYDRHKK